MKKLPWKLALIFSFSILAVVLLYPLVLIMVVSNKPLEAFTDSISSNLPTICIGFTVIFLLLLFVNTQRFRANFPKVMVWIFVAIGYIFILSSTDPNLQYSIKTIVDPNYLAGGITIIAFAVALATLLGIFDNNNKENNMKTDKDEKPILVEDLASNSGDDMLKLIGQNDRSNRERSVRLIPAEIKIFDKALRLQYEALAFAVSNSKNWTIADRVVVAMACRAVRQLRAARELILYGFWAEVFVLERSVHEALTREWFFFQYPPKASKWFKGKEQIKQKEVDEALAGQRKVALKDLRQHYAYLSQHSHPNLEAIRLETWGGDQEIGEKGIIAGPIAERYFKAQFQSLLTTALIATRMCGIVGLHRATDIWKKEVIDLEAEVEKLANPSETSSSNK